MLKTMKILVWTVVVLFLLSTVILFHTRPVQTTVYEEIVVSEFSVHSTRMSTTDIQKEWCKKNISCATLAEAGYYEARNQDDIGVVAVMRVIINRSEHTRWPDTIEGVVYQRCQFSYVCDGSLEKAQYEQKQWVRMYILAYNVLFNEKGKQRFSGITHYHTKRVNPYWKKHYKEVVVVGDHIFYQCVKDC